MNGVLEVAEMQLRRDHRKVENSALRKVERMLDARAVFSHVMMALQKLWVKWRSEKGEIGRKHMAQHAVSALDEKTDRSRAVENKR